MGISACFPRLFPQSFASHLLHTGPEPAPVPPLGQFFAADFTIFLRLKLRLYKLHKAALLPPPQKGRIPGTKDSSYLQVSAWHLPYLHQLPRSPVLETRPLLLCPVDLSPHQSRYNFFSLSSPHCVGLAASAFYYGDQVHPILVLILSMTPCCAGPCSTRSSCTQLAETNEEIPILSIHRQDSTEAGTRIEAPHVALSHLRPLCEHEH